MDLEQIFGKLWEAYAGQNPLAWKIHALFNARGDLVRNDHIAFRTFNDPRLNIDVLARPFVDRGYVPAGKYRFREKHLFARHYEPPGEEDLPRVFISELLLEEFSSGLHDRIRALIGEVDPGVWRREALILAGPVFGQPAWTVYENLRRESEYAAWLYVHGLRANHFTVSVNALESFASIEEVNEFLKSRGFTLNSSGGEVKGSRKKLLKQSSTLAGMVSLQFSEGIREVPACYYEFAERFKDADGKLFSGFVAGSADKIFESTDFHGQKGSDR